METTGRKRVATTPVVTRCGTCIGCSFELTEPARSDAPAGVGDGGIAAGAMSMKIESGEPGRPVWSPDRDVRRGRRDQAPVVTASPTHERARRRAYAPQRGLVTA